MSLHSAPFEILAPGKLMLLGEYAVLAGAPALVSAVNRFARVSWTPAGEGGAGSPEVHRDEARSLHIRSRLIAGGVWSLALDQDGFVEPGAGRAPDGSALLAALLDTFREWSLPVPAGTLEIDSDALSLRVGTEKLGLGSSAAVTAACAAALAPVDTCPDRDEEGAAALALAAHHRFQHGRGSGVDVRAALRGGVCLCRDETTERVAENLPLRVFYAGNAADTRVLLDMFAAWRVAQPRKAAHLVENLTRIAEAGAKAARQGDIHALAECFRAHDETVGRITECGGPTIVTPELAAISELAALHGWFAKPSGAGGGDCAVALPGPRASKAEALDAAIEAAGYLPLRVGTAALGALPMRRSLLTRSRNSA